MKKILVMNGPNLDMLGVREPSVYGHDSLSDLEREVRDYGKRHGVDVVCFQSNSEGKLIRKIHAARDVYDGIVYNPGAHTHYSYALRDAVGGMAVPVVEVHISDVDTREAFRHISVIAPACVAQVKGRGFKGYCDAIDLLLEGAGERLGEGFEGRYAPGQVIVGGCDVLAADAAAKDESAVDFAALDQAALVQSGASARRLDRLRAACAHDDIPAFYARSTSNIAWLTAFDNVFDDENAHAILVTPDNATLHTDTRYSTAASAAAAAEGSITVDAAPKTHAVFVADAFAAASGNQQAVETLGIEDALALSEYRELEAALAKAPARPALRETANMILDVRAVKESSEIARMKAAQAVTDAAFTYIRGFIRLGMTEREVQIELEDFMRRHGAQGLAFSSIVACGANGASPHAIPGATRLEAGQCMVIDFGARAYGYCSDMTRTVFLGEPDARLRDAYAAIRSANEQVEAALKPGVTGKAMHELAEQVLAERGFAGKMGHGLGHGVGMDIHEEPVLAPRNDRPLAVGNVVTVEPGVYFPGEFGMRLEDFGVVTNEGFEVFTQSTHDMVIL